MRARELIRNLEEEWEKIKEERMKDPKYERFNKKKKFRNRMDNRNENNGNENSKSFLDKDKIEISAEHEGLTKPELKQMEYNENPGPIEPFDSLNRIKEKSEDIQAEVREQNQEDIRQDQEKFDEIRIEREDLDSKNKEKKQNTGDSAEDLVNNL